MSLLYRIDCDDSIATSRLCFTNMNIYYIYSNIPTISQPSGFQKIDHQTIRRKACSATMAFFSAKLQCSAPSRASSRASMALENERRVSMFNMFGDYKYVYTNNIYIYTLYIICHILYIIYIYILSMYTWMYGCNTLQFYKWFIL